MISSYENNVKDFTVKHLLLFEIHAREYVKILFTNIQKQ